MKTKRCTLGTCGKEHPLENMVRNCSMKDGYTNICKPCKQKRDNMTREERLSEKPIVNTSSVGSAGKAKIKRKITSCEGSWMGGGDSWLY